MGHPALRDALRSVLPRAPETVEAPRRVHRQGLDDLEHDRGHRREEYLRDALPPRDGERRVPQVDQRHQDLAAVVGVERSRAVDEGDPMLQRQPRPWSHLPLPALRNREGDAARDQAPLTRGKDQRGVRRHRRAQIEAGRAGRGARGERKSDAVREHLDRNHEGRRHVARPNVAAAC